MQTDHNNLKFLFASFHHKLQKNLKVETKMTIFCEHLISISNKMSGSGHYNTKKICLTENIL